MGTAGQDVALVHGRPMRVIAGKFRSRTLKALPGLETRPTYDRLKETLFNVLAPAGNLEGAVFIDLFAGTGSVGIEALSRGAAQVYFVECSRKAARVIRENLAALQITEGYEILEKRATEALLELSARPVRCRFCFLDPPYKMKGAYEEVLRLIAGLELLSEAGLVIAEHDKHFDPGEGAGRLQRYRCLRQGESLLSFYSFEQR
jgi:16S rRNA (guanine(966)-N(2))-methyltransferase RsmD